MHHDTSVDMNGVRVNGMKEQEQRLRRMEIQFGRARLVPRPWELFGHQVSIVPRDSDPDLDPGRDLSISLDLNPSPVILRSNGANDDQESGLFSPGSDLADDESGDVFGASPSPCRLSPVTLMPSQYLRTDVSEVPAVTTLL
nr:hypothetical protein BaRGS_034552 [Batillaria attramentaria]